MSRPVAAAESDGGRRLDIQGLRGLAIVPGFIYHMTDLIPGSVILIDMFFVASGFLITGRLIYLAQTRTVGGYYLEFYKFRVKRLFPASITAILITTAVAGLLYVQSRYDHIRADAVSALLFFANIRDAAQGTDYMHRTETTSPLLPFWSLSLEEQYYVVWPIVVLLVMTWAAKRQRQRSALTWASTLILVLSFAYGFWFTRAHPVAAYYDTLSRCWDFAAGSLLAVYAMRRRLSAPSNADGSLPGRAGARLATWGARLNAHASLVSWIGTGFLIAAILFTPTDHGFPVPWAAMGAIGTVLVIYAGIDQRPRNWILNNRVLVWLGDLSFAIYLVHFPVIMFASSYLADRKPMLYSFDAVATVALALLMYYFIEEPGRRGFKATRAWFRAGKHRPVVNAVAVSATVATILFAATPRTPALWAGTPADAPPIGAGVAPSERDDAAVPSSPAAPTKRPTPFRFTDPHLVSPTAAVEHALTSSLALTSWPHLSNEDRIDNLSSFLGECDAVDALHPPCVATPPGGTTPGKVALAWGDSIMLAYWPMLRDAFLARGWTLVVIARKDCEAALLPDQHTSSRDCISYQTYAKTLQHWRPSLVLMTTNAPTFLTDAHFTGSGAAMIAKATATYTDGMKAIVAMAQRAAARAVLLSPPPWTDETHQPGACVVAGSSPQNCVYAPSRAWFTLNAIDRQVADATGATYADLLPFFCVDGMCPSVMDGVVVHADNEHITPEEAALLAPSFEQYLVGKGLAP